jgi:hypothetical protein
LKVIWGQPVPFGTHKLGAPCLPGVLIWKIPASPHKGRRRLGAFTFNQLLSEGAPREQEKAVSNPKAHVDVALKFLASPKPKPHWTSHLYVISVSEAFSTR